VVGWGGGCHTNSNSNNGTGLTLVPSSSWSLYQMESRRKIQSVECGLVLSGSWLCDMGQLPDFWQPSLLGTRGCWFSLRGCLLF
jgi:hypothetical protein